jgi:choline kinase
MGWNEHSIGQQMSAANMKGIILAAGKGARFEGSNGDPKCLAHIGGMTLIERQVESLRKAGIDEITVVVGFGGERIRAVLGTRVRYVENLIFEQTDSLYSLSLARDAMSGGFVVLNSDVLFTPRMLDDLLGVPHEDALLVHYLDHTAQLGSEEMKVQIRAGRVADISKTIKTSEADGENVGIVKFGTSGARFLINQIDLLLAAGCDRCSAPRAFLEFARHRPLYAVGTRGLPWIEIDFPSDYLRAVTEILPKMRVVDSAPYNYAGAS